MKTPNLWVLAAVASCAVGTGAFAAQPGSPTRMMKTAKFSSDAASPARTWDDQPPLLRTIGYPVVLLGRAGHTVFRSPQILSETIEGDRSLVSKRGLLAGTEGKMDRP